jgi:hypothetical protein
METKRTRNGLDHAAEDRVGLDNRAIGIDDDFARHLGQIVAIMGWRGSGTGDRLMDVEAGRQRGALLPGRGARAAVLALGPLVLVAIALLTARVAIAYPVSSDDATGVLEAAAVLRGNLLLTGWTVSNISFVTTDLPFYIAGVAIKGLNPTLLRDIPSAVYAVAVGTAVVLAALGARSAWLAAATVIVLLALPAGGLAEFVTKGYTRVGTSIGLFAALIALEGPVKQKVSIKRLGLYMLAIALTLLSDTFTMVIAVVAVLIVCLLGVIRRETYEDLGVSRVAGATVLAVALALCVSWAIRALGGFESAPLPLKDYLSTGEPLRMFVSNAWALAVNLPSLYRCDMPTGVAWSDWAVWLGCFFGPLLLVYALFWGSPVWRHRLRADFAGDVLWVSMMLGLGAFMASANAKDRGTLRYMVPFVLSGAVLTGRVVGRKTRSIGSVVLILSVIATAYGVTVTWDLRKAPAADPAIALASWLSDHGLKQGYGPYWDASIVTASGRGQVAVRPVRGRILHTGERVIEPFRWMSDKAWYLDAPANFVVFKRDPAPKFGFLIDEHLCAACFGTPSAIHSVGPFIVMVWDHDLRPKLVRDLPWVP